jgi:hypothetical protein
MTVSVTKVCKGGDKNLPDCCPLNNVIRNKYSNDFSMSTEMITDFCATTRQNSETEFETGAERTGSWEGSSTDQR